MMHATIDDTHPGQIKKLVSRLRRQTASQPNLRLGFLTPRRSPSPESRSAKARRTAASLDLWNAAYDSLADDPGCAGLVRAYESVISQELPPPLKRGGLHSSFRGKTQRERLDLCAAITTAGLQKRNGSCCADDMARRMLESAKGQVDGMTCPSRSIAWAGFCTLTPVRTLQML